MRLLVIRPGAIGDTLLTFPVLQALRACYSDPRVALAGNASVLPLAQACGVAEELYDYEHIQWSELFSTRGVRNPALVDVLRRTDRAICWLRDSDGLVERNLRAMGIEDIVIAPGRPAPGGALHIVQYLAETIALPIDFEVLRKCEGRGQVGRRSEGRRLAAPVHEIGGEVLENDQRPSAIHPGSSAPSKCWPAPYFAAVIEQVWQQGRPVLLLAGPADQERLDDVLRALPAQDTWGSLKVLKNASLLELACKLQECKDYLGNDSGITHLAAMLGIPTVALFGPSDVVIWHPLGPRVRVIRENSMEHLHLATVIATLRSF